MAHTHSQPAGLSGGGVVYTTKQKMEEVQTRIDEIGVELRQIALDLSNAPKLKDGESERSSLLERFLQLQSEKRELVAGLSRAQVPCGSAERVEVGSRVTFLNLGTGEERFLILVSANGNPLKERTISTGTPVAQALLGRCVEDEVEVPTADGQRIQKLRITAISEGGS